MRGTVVAGALVAAFVAYVAVVVAATDDPEPVSAPPPTTTTTTTSPRPSGPRPTAHDEAATRGGDAAPHEAENRGAQQPGELTDAQRQQLDAKGRELEPVLERVRAAGTITPEAVTAALVGAGYPADHVSAVPRTLSTDGVTRYVVFGVEIGDACVSGMVTPTEVQALGMGRVPEWGCVPPDTH